MNNKIKQLEREIMDLKIKQHKDSYIHINYKSIGLFFALLGSMGLAIGNLFILIANWNLLNIGEIFKPNTETNYTLISFNQLGIIPQILFEYVLIGLVFICLVALIKGGFDKLKSYEEEGLIFGLIVGIIIGLIVGLIFGLIVGIIFGLIFGLIVGLIFGLIVGIIFGLIWEVE